MASDNAHREKRGSLLPWVIAGALVLTCLVGWMLGAWTNRPADALPPVPFLLAFRLTALVGWPLLLSAVIFLSSASVGAAALGLMRAEGSPPLARLLFAAAIGLGISAYATLALGVAGILQAGVFWGLMAVMFLVGFRELRTVLTDLRRQARQWVSSWGRFEWGLALAGVAIVVVGILCAGTPVLDYDTLGYHLGAPGEYFAAGKVRFLPHNVYAGFPAQVEMLYLLGIVLGGSRSVGMGVAVLIQVGFGALAALAAGTIAARFVRREAALPAAVFFLSCPLFMVTVVRGHITLARCFYTALALLAVLEWLFGEKGRLARRSYLILGGLCCGLAVAVKYTAVLMLCLPLGVVVLGVCFFRNDTWRRRLVPAALFGGCALLAVLPWFVKNAAATGNPVFPLLDAVFGARGWSAEQAAKFAAAHAAPPLRSIADFPVEIWRFLTGHVGPMSKGFAGPLAVVFIPMLLLTPRSEAAGREGSPWKARIGPVAFFLCYALAVVLLWGAVTHRIARFLAPSLVVLSVLSAGGFVAAQRGRLPGGICRTLALVLAFFALFYQAAVAASAGGPAAVLAGRGLSQMARRGGFSYLRAVEWIKDPDNVPSGAGVMLVGEARTYHFERPVLYSTVFNDHPIEPALRLARDDLARAVSELKSRGVTHVLVNWSELRRLSETYRYVYEGQEQPGYLPEVDLESREPLLRLLNAAGDVAQSYGSMAWPGRDSPSRIPAIEIYDLRTGRGQR